MNLKIKAFLIIIFLIISFSLKSHSAILIEENGRSSIRTNLSSYSGSISFRKDRRVGVGLVSSGLVGLAGLSLELNFTPSDSLLTLFGGGQSYQTFSFQWKKVLSGNTFVPYFSLGYSRWYSVGTQNEFEEAYPNFLNNKLLNQRQKEHGEFVQDLIVPSLGLQYLQLSGPWVGSSLFIELTILLDIVDFISIPTGTAGIQYYF